MRIEIPPQLFGVVERIVNDVNKIEHCGIIIIAALPNHPPTMLSNVTDEALELIFNFMLDQANNKDVEIINPGEPS